MLIKLMKNKNKNWLIELDKLTISPINPQKHMVFQGVDIDLICCQMSFIQTALMGLTGEIIHGDTIALNYWQRFVTPMTLLHFDNYKKFQESPINKNTKNQINKTIEQDCTQLKLL